MTSEPGRRRFGWHEVRLGLGIIAFIYLILGGFVAAQFKFWHQPALGASLVVLWILSFMFLVHLALLWAEGEFPSRNQR